MANGSFFISLYSRIAMAAIDAPEATSSSAECRPCDSRPSLLQDDDDIATVVPLQSYPELMETAVVRRKWLSRLHVVRRAFLMA